MRWGGAATVLAVHVHRQSRAGKIAIRLTACGHAVPVEMQPQAAGGMDRPCNPLPSLPLMVEMFALPAQVQLEWVKLLPLK